MEVKVRKSVPDDVYGIRDVQRETWLVTYPNEEEGISLEDIQRKFKDDNTSEGKQKIEERKKGYGNENSNIWVAEDNGRIVGFCGALKEGENNRIGALYVLPVLQGTGLGCSLIQKALDWLGDKKDVYVNVARYNKQAINFYKKFGFVESGKSGVLDVAAKLPSGKIIPEIELIKYFPKK
jgi:GNAT superfamily N-acetyltransferase